MGHLEQECMAIPTKQKWLQIADRYLTLWNMPHCLGSIDGKLIRLRNPSCSGSSYFNYKGYCSTILMATVDADRLFISVGVGALGRNSNGGVFCNGNFGRTLSIRLLHLPKESILSGDDKWRTIPFYFVADEVFSLNQHIMRPYPQRGLTNEKQIFNYGARRMFEFGMLVSKFRVFELPISCNPDTADIIRPACILHNYIRIREGKIVTPSMEYIIKHSYSDDNRNNTSRTNNRRVTNEGTAIRAKLISYFMKQDGAIPSQFRYK